ncbi:MAG TPA: GlsB/YeaQ/YmgE family stress response membrane protein [Actinomycetota bacterium]
MNLLWWLLIGLVAGAIARLLVPGRDRLGFLGTILLGLVGSLIGGLIGQLFKSGKQDFLQDFTPAGVIGSIIGAIVALLIYRWINARRGVAR